MGIVTDSDFTSKVIAENRIPKETDVDDIMSSDLKTVSPDETVLNVTNMFEKEKIKKALVVDNNKILGIISITDIIHNMIN
jgi:signal-transduction protein with cAMP-binding, CBS, and nucleotidyltransferase domain